MVYDSGELEKLSSNQLALESFVYRKNKEVMTKIKVCLKLSREY